VEIQKGEVTQSQIARPKRGSASAPYAHPRPMFSMNDRERIRRKNLAILIRELEVVTTWPRRDLRDARSLARREQLSKCPAWKLKRK
jgi:hypothetical protein